jgi:hypothetical protein
VTRLTGRQRLRLSWYRFRLTAGNLDHDHLWMLGPPVSVE